MQLQILQPRRSAASDAQVPASAPHFETGPRSIGAVRVLRISLTDRCNLRCVYCMPADGMRWMPRHLLLSADEIAEVARAAAELHGIARFKLTGGEPTVRADLLRVVQRLRAIDGARDLSLTTNGILLERLALPLRDAGLDRVTISIDSLREDRFRRITRGGELRAVLRGLDACERAGFGSTKVNVVSMRGINDDELVDFARLALDRDVTVRFIEYMPLGDAAVMHCGSEIADAERGPSGGCGAQDRGADVFIPEQEVRDRIERALGPLEPIDRSLEAGVGPSVVYALSRAGARGRIGFISAMSQPFCSTCNRLRLTADGVLRSCLFDGGEVEIRSILRSASDPPHRRHRRLAQAMTACVRLRPVLHSHHGNEQMSRLGG